MPARMGRYANSHRLFSQFYRGYRTRDGDTALSNGGPACEPADHSICAKILTHFWFKCFGTMGFIAIFFSAYIYLLKNPAHPVTVMPATWIDSVVTFHPFALAIYVTLWLYVSLPVVLMQTRGEIAGFGLWMGGVCLAAIAVFYCWPSAVPPANIDWAAYPGMAFLKGVDSAGNAFPSLHVATAVFTGIWLNRQLTAIGLGRVARSVNVSWCVLIVYSTLATKQHVAIDAIAGVLLGVLFAAASAAVTKRRLRSQNSDA
jgi:membrane-associated phospholipid phosphatase